MANKFSKSKPSPKIVDTLNRKQVSIDNENFKVSFQYLDTTQKFGSGFLDWQKMRFAFKNDGNFTRLLS